MICGEGGRDFFDLFAEFRAGGAEVELDFVIERAWRARCEDFDGFDVEIFFEDVLEAASGFESDVVGGPKIIFESGWRILSFCASRALRASFVNASTAAISSRSSMSILDSSAVGYISMWTDSCGFSRAPLARFW